MTVAAHDGRREEDLDLFTAAFIRLMHAIGVMKALGSFVNGVQLSSLGI